MPISFEVVELCHHLLLSFLWYIINIHPVMNLLWWLQNNNVKIISFCHNILLNFFSTSNIGGVAGSGCFNVLIDLTTLNVILQGLGEGWRVFARTILLIRWASIKWNKYKFQVSIILTHLWKLISLDLPDTDSIFYPMSCVGRRASNLIIYLSLLWF